MAEQTVIKPTIGRVVWFYPQHPNTVQIEPLCALIAKVWNTGCINLAYFNGDGIAKHATSVPLIQDGDPVPGNGFYCEWMPYQKGQAAKTEALEKKVISDVASDTGSLSNDAIEQEIIDKALTAPRVTPDRLEQVIISEQYHVFSNSTFTACLLTLENGYTVLGESACASPENFDAELGRKIARKNAVNKIWSLEGYLLRQKLHEQQLTANNNL